MIKRIVVYFHGFDSSENSHKVARLRAAFPTDKVLAFHAV